MIEILEKHKPVICAEITSIIFTAKQDFTSINSWAEETLNIIESLAVKGKMVRGSLFLEMIESLGVKKEGWHVTVAASIELFHTGLLIHDDIMDNDYVRRGTPALFAQFISIGERDHVKNPYRFGVSQGISGGDVAFFLANKVIADSADIPAAVFKKLVAYFSHELISVGFAQMDDVFAGSTNSFIQTERIIQTYRYKTARYTFSLPIEAACLAADFDKLKTANLSNIGETLGIIFQIKDDELGLFGDESQTGKLIGSDIRERKQTLIFGKLVERGELSEIEKYFGSPVLSRTQVEFVRDHIKTTEALRDVEVYVQNLASEVKKDIQKIEEDSVQDLFNKILEFNLSRYA